MKIDLQLSKVLLWLAAVDFGTVSHFDGVVLKIRDATMSTMLLVHNGFNNTFSIPGSYVHDDGGHVECGLRHIQSKLGIRIERHNGYIFVTQLLFFLMLQTQFIITHIKESFG